MSVAATETRTDYLRALPGDDVRQILWRFADRFDLQMLVQSVRAVARGPVARLVAQGARNTHEWTPEKQALLERPSLRARAESLVELLEMKMMLGRTAGAPPVAH